MSLNIKKRTGTTAQWIAANPVLLDGEPGYDSTRKQFKIGDGSTPYLSLPYFKNEGRRVLTVPTGYPVTPLALPTLTRRGYTGSVGPRSLAPTPTNGGVYYVDVATGSDGAAGTAAAPFQSIYFALQKNDVGIVHVAPGIYGRTNGWGSPTYTIGATDNFIVKKWQKRAGGEVIVSHAEDGLTWTASSGLWYSSPAFQTQNVVDLLMTLPGGAYMTYAKCATLAECQKRFGSWWWDTGTSRLYVNPLVQGAAPPPTTLCMGGFNSIVIVGRRTVYIEGFTVISGAVGVLPLNNTGADGGRTILNQVRAYNCQNGGIQPQGVAEVAMFDCEAKRCGGDGIGFVVNGAQKTTNGVAIRCISNDNGVDASGADVSNGFTSHDGMRVTLIECEATGNTGPQYAHVNASSKTWLVGCRAGQSTARDFDNQSNSFQFLSGNEAWLADCDGENHSGLLNSSSTVWTDNSYFGVTSGTIGSYTQT